MSKIISWILLVLYALWNTQVKGQITNNPPVNSFKDSYSSGTYTRCAYNINISETHLTAGVNYTAKAGQSIRVQASSGTTPYSNIGSFTTGTFHAFVDPNYNLTGCGLSNPDIVWDNYYTGDGSIAREMHPINYQLYPRKANNYGNVVFSGTDNGGNSSIAFYTYKTNFNNVRTLYNSTVVSIVNNRFYFSLPINAELSEYEFWYYINNDLESGGSLIANHVVCGDAYIISGQSNAIANNLTQTEVDNLINTYGAATTYGKYSRSYSSIFDVGQESWGVSSVGNTDLNHHVGAWGLPIQYKIEQTYGIPTCIVNGAVAETSIEQHLPPSSYPNDFFYNSLHYANNQGLFALMNTRVYKAGVENDIKGIFWWQGDAGGPEDNTTYNYIDHFTPLYNLWATYYPNFKQSYIVQIPSWVGNDPGVRIRSEQQRQMGGVFPNTTVMSANGIMNHRTDEPGHEIHHHNPAYIDLAGRLFGLLEKDVYGKTTNINDLTPPDISLATISGNQVTLRFNQDVFVNTALGENIYDILSVIKFNNEVYPYPSTVAKSNPVISGKYLTFDISSSAGLTSVSYAGFIPNTTVTNIDNLRCYLRNSKNIGALSFYNIALTPPGPAQRNALSQDNKEDELTSADILNTIQIYPNPFNNELTVGSKSNLPVNSIRITDVMGRVVFEKENTLKQVTFDLAFLKAGIYFILAETENRVEKSKLVKIDN
ncbi:MAG: T9SS type A sorting domain-containing protein [Bacteroidota bacterium]